MSTTNPVGVLAQGQTQTWIGRFLNKVKAEAQTIGSEVVDFFEHKAFPYAENFLRRLFMDEIAMAEPFLQEAGKELEADLPKLFTDPGAFIGLATAIARVAWQKIQAQAGATAISVSESTLLTGAQMFLHNYIAANGSQQPKAA